MTQLPINGLSQELVRPDPGKTHFADDDTLAHIARLEAELDNLRTAFAEMDDILRELIRADETENDADYYCALEAAKKLLSTPVEGAVARLEARARREAAMQAGSLLLAAAEKFEHDQSYYWATELRKFAEQKEREAASSPTTPSKDSLA